MPEFSRLKHLLSYCETVNIDVSEHVNSADTLRLDEMEQQQQQQELLLDN